MIRKWFDTRLPVRIFLKRRFRPFFNYLYSNPECQSRRMKNPTRPLSVNRAYISLGSNLGDAPANLAAARDVVASFQGITIGAVSSVFRTEPQGMREQPFFLNQIMELGCSAQVEPLALLDLLLEAELALGRRRGAQRYGPRLIDLDLLLFGNKRMNNARLTLPHPRMLERAFVLVPLAEIAPDLQLPQGMSAGRALASLQYTQRGGTIFQHQQY